MKDELAKYYEITECCCSTDTHPSTTEKCWNPHCMWATASVQMQPNDAFTERLQGWADSVDDLLAQVASATSELGASSKRSKTATKDKTGADYVAPLKSVAAGSSGGGHWQPSPETQRCTRSRRQLGTATLRPSPARSARCRCFCI